MGVVVGDATGKGMPAALVVSATSSMLRAVAQALGSSSPGQVLARVNETLFAPHSSQHVCDLLLRHSRARERHLELRQRWP